MSEVVHISPDKIEIPDFTKEDYLKTTKPYEWLYQYKDNDFLMMQLVSQVKLKADEKKVRNFTGLWRSYLASVKAKNALIMANNVTEFTNQELELHVGNWKADDLGITGYDRSGYEIEACNHPLMPVQRLVNIDTETEKLKLAYKKRGGSWRSIIADKKTLASANSIVSLAEYGIAVNSENSKNLVRYLTEIENLNIDVIPEINSVGRLGWIDSYGFSPYVDNLIFDGDLNFKHFFDSVKEVGKYEKWLEIARVARKDSIIARIILASSFASVLIKPCNALPFFVHLWGGTESGKTVGLMLATSVWANPAMGAYMQTFNSTQVGQEVTATFMNSLPLVLDELQVIGDRKDFDKLIYTLSEGIGRSRGSKTGGLQKTGTWQNCILTTGEQPITNGSSMSGAVNRIIEIDCKSEKLFKDPVHVVDVLKKNYGFAGKQLVSMLEDETNLTYAISIQKEIYKSLVGEETTEKQSMAASVILTADRLINEWFFKDGVILTKDEIMPYLVSKSQVSAHERALEYILDTVAINPNKFKVNDFGEMQGEAWGCVEKDDNKVSIYIIKTQFNKLMQAEGFNPTAFLSWAKEKGILRHAKGRNTILKRIYGNTTNCICIVQNEYQNCENPPIEDLPFDDL